MPQKPMCKHAPNHFAKWTVEFDPTPTYSGPDRDAMGYVTWSVCSEHLSQHVVMAETLSDNEFVVIERINRFA